MLKYFQVSGYAVNKRGNTIGIFYDVQSTSAEQAIIKVEQNAIEDGFRYIRLTRTILQEVRHESA
ncbi:hypothetical protein ACY0L0_002899 [Serratia marcescens]